MGTGQDIDWKPLFIFNALSLGDFHWKHASLAGGHVGYSLKLKEKDSTEHLTRFHFFVG